MPYKAVKSIDPPLKTHYTSSETALLRPLCSSKEHAMIAWGKQNLPMSVALALECNIKGQAMGFGAATSDELRLIQKKAGELNVTLNI